MYILFIHIFVYLYVFLIYIYISVCVYASANGTANVNRPQCLGGAGSDFLGYPSDTYLLPIKNKMGTKTVISNKHSFIATKHIHG